MGQKKANTKRTKIQKFYRYYLTQHGNRTCRRLHFFGTLMVLTLLVFVITTQNWKWLLLAPVLGYTPAWVGHFFFEKNKPASFDYPLLSLICDFRMFREMLTGKIKF